MRIEPSGDMRVMAAMMRQSYEAFLSVGFSRAEALQLTRDILITSLQSQQGNDEKGEK